MKPFDKRELAEAVRQLLDKDKKADRQAVVSSISPLGLRQKGYQFLGILVIYPAHQKAKPIPTTLEFTELLGFAVPPFE